MNKEKNKKHLRDKIFKQPVWISGPDDNAGMIAIQSQEDMLFYTEAFASGELEKEDRSYSDDVISYKMRAQSKESLDRLKEEYLAHVEVVLDARDGMKSDIEENIFSLEQWQRFLHYTKKKAYQRCFRFFETRSQPLTIEEMAEGYFIKHYQK